MTKILCILFVFALQQTFGLEFFVDGKNGRDSNPGTQAAPFQSITKAVDAIRALPSLANPVVVQIRAGDYFLTQPLILGSKDSGNSKATITYQAYSNEVVRILGGQSIPFDAWKPVTDQSILDRLPAEAVGNVVQANLKSLGITNYGRIVNGGLGTCANDKLELFLNSRPMLVSRYPNIAANGTWQYNFIQKVVSPNSFTYDGNRPSRWTSAEDLWLHGFWSFDWADNYVRVSSIDTTSSTFHIDQGTTPLYGLVATARYYALNLLEELDAPGEYYLEKRTGILYFYPPRPVTAQDQVHVSLAENLIQATEGLNYVTLKNLRFAFSRRDAITIQGSNIQILNCDISNNGGTSVVFNGANSVFDSNTIMGNGCSGISVSGGDEKTLTSANIVVSNNHIYNYARWTRTYNPGIAWSGVGNRFIGNTIHDAPHNGILGGGSKNMFDRNHLYKLCYEVDDSGAFYAGRSWIERGNVIQNSLFEDIQMIEPIRLGSPSVQAIYLDDQLSGWSMLNNTFVNCHVGIFIGGGRRNIAKGNTFKNCSTSVHIDNRGMNWQKDSCKPGGTLEQQLQSVNYKNPPWSVQFPELVNIMNDHPCVPVYNTVVGNVYCGGKEFIDVQESDIKAWLDTVENNVQKC